MGGSTTKFEKLYDFLARTDESGEEYELDDLRDATGYAESTIRTYLTKKLQNYIVYELEAGTFVSDGVTDEFSTSEFVEYMSQKSSRVAKSSEDRLAESLFDRASDGILLALESYNRPSLDNRAEAFCMLATNAWELLLKGEIVTSEGESEIYRNDDSGYTISIGEALEKTIPDENSPVRENIEQLVGLRNQAVHLLLDDLEPVLVELFQATVLNFRERYENATGEYFVDLNPGLLSLAVDRAHIKPAVIKRRYGTETHRKVESFLEIYRAKQRSHDEKFAIPVEYRLVLTEEPGEADIKLREGDGGEGVAAIVQPEPIDKTHPYRPKDVVERITEHLPKGEELSVYNITSVDHAHKIRNGHNDELYQQLTNPTVNRYSEAYVEWFIEQYEENDNFLQHASDVYQQYLQAQRD